MADFNELMKQAREMQEQLKQAQQDALKTEVEGQSGAGLVRVVMNGRHDVKRVTLDQSLMREDKEVVEDLVAAAVNDAVRKIEDRNREALSGMASGFRLPEGFKFPF